ncbi:uncharacterized protein LOC135152123 [Daucus carota subsp. sativus]|uniref:uncharacterized protein LOC135152123 n=1 Tax=Daucus carota subsp. sativus TaxID=79200 RepID=UPI003082F2EF
MKLQVVFNINGVLEGFFQGRNGLRQGDPLSPYLFVLSMEVLSSFLKAKLNSDDSFNFHWRTKPLQLSHVIFADDIFLFCKGESNSIRLLLDSVLQFSGVSGLQLNKEKCLGFFSCVPNNVISHTLNHYGFQLGSLPISYLGLPLITSRLNESICAPLIQRLSRKVESWTVRHLRYSGRLQLIKTVLQGIQSYWSLYLFLPVGVLKRIQSILARFLWAGDLHSSCHYKVAWADCCFIREEGGLGLRDLFDWNKAAILFQVWRLAHPNPSSIWLLWVHSCMLKRKHFWTTKIPYKCPWNLRKILNHRREALRFISCKVMAGSSFKFWYDPWLISVPLIERFGDGIISVMDSSHEATVGSAIVNGYWAVSSSNDFRATQIRSLISSCSIARQDAVVNLRVIWESIRRRGPSSPWIPLIWSKFNIPSCSFISWLACRNRLSTKDRLFNIQQVVDPLCCLCRSNAESAEHLFTSCPYTYLVLRACPFDLFINWNAWMLGNFFTDALTNFQKQMAFLYITTAIYSIWKERNRRIHDDSSMSVDNIIRLVKRMFREKLFSCPEFRRKVHVEPHLSQLLF